MNKKEEKEISISNKNESIEKKIINQDNKEIEIKTEENNNNIKTEEDKNNLDEEILVDKYVSKIENEQKEKSKRHISINEEKNIFINFKPEDPVTDIKIKKQGEEDLVPFERDFNLYQKILKSSIKYNPSIKKFDKNEIKIDPDYKLAEFLEEKDIIPELVEDNDDDIRSLEKSMERSIDKSFDKNYERSLNLSVNQSNNQSINQSYNQSYMDNSFRNSGKFGNSTGGGLIQKLNKMFDINEDKSEYEENENEESQNDKDEETNKDKDIEEIEENEEEENHDEDKNEEDEKEKDEEKVEEEELEREQENERENEEDIRNNEQQENNDENDNDNDNEEEENEEK